MFVSKTIAFVGPLQPPVHGLSTVHLKMMNVCTSPTANPVTFDTAARGSFHIFRELSRFLMWLVRNPDRPVYLSVSGGVRQMLELAYVVMSRLFMRRIFLHHHSFAYIDSITWYSRLFFSVCNNCRHLVLCSCMGESLSRRYGIIQSKIIILSNLAFVGEVNEETSEPSNDRPTTVGFISNITREKGVFLFLEIVSQLFAAGSIKKALIAGPIESGLEAEFSEALAAYPFVVYQGPLYGLDKQKFWTDIDLLIFPTLYRNEAEPLVLLEAASQGVRSCALTRGCIAEMLPNTILSAAHEPVALTECVSRLLNSIPLNPIDRNKQREKVRAEYRTLRAGWHEKLKEISSTVSQ